LPTHTPCAELTNVPGGSLTPHSVSPSPPAAAAAAGTAFQNGAITTGGNRRRPSRTTASRYGSARASLSRMTGLAEAEEEEMRPSAKAVSSSDWRRV
jgi:hypothetical protein